MSRERLTEDEAVALLRMYDRRPRDGSIASDRLSSDFRRVVEKCFGGYQWIGRDRVYLLRREWYVPTGRCGLDSAGLWVSHGDGRVRIGDYRMRTPWEGSPVAIVSESDYPDTVYVLSWGWDSPKIMARPIVAAPATWERDDE